MELNKAVPSSYVALNILEVFENSTLSNSLFTSTDLSFKFSKLRANPPSPIKYLPSAEEFLVEFCPLIVSFNAIPIEQPTAL